MRKITVIGNVGADPEMKYLPNGSVVTNFSVAVTYKVQGGDDETQWYRCVAFGKTAEFVNEYVQKGDRMLVEGPLRLKHFERRDGTPGQELEVTVRETFLLSPPREEEPAEAAPRKSTHRPGR